MHASKGGRYKTGRETMHALPYPQLFPSSLRVAIDPLRTLWTTRRVFEFISYGPTRGSKSLKNARNQSAEASAEAKEKQTSRNKTRGRTAEGFRGRVRYFISSSRIKKHGSAGVALALKPNPVSIMSISWCCSG